MGRVVVISLDNGTSLLRTYNKHLSATQVIRIPLSMEDTPGILRTEKRTTHKEAVRACPPSVGRQQKVIRLEHVPPGGRKPATGHRRTAARCLIALRATPPRRLGWRHAITHHPQRGLDERERRAPERSRPRRPTLAPLCVKRRAGVVAYRGCRRVREVTCPKSRLGDESWSRWSV
jgi:hypothetical protein